MRRDSSRFSTGRLIWLLIPVVAVVIALNLMGGAQSDRAELSLDRVQALIDEGVVVEAVI